MKTRHSSVRIVGLPSLSMLKSRSSSPLKATLMSLSAVHHVARRGEQAVMEIVAMATDPNAKCSLPYVLSAVRNAKSLSNPVKADLYIVVSAIIKSSCVNKVSLVTKTYLG